MSCVHGARRTSCPAAPSRLILFLPLKTSMSIATQPYTIIRTTAAVSVLEKGLALVSVDLEGHKAKGVEARWLHDRHVQTRQLGAAATKAPME